MKALALIFRRELALAWSGGGGPLLALGFYVGDRDAGAAGDRPASRSAWPAIAAGDRLGGAGAGLAAVAGAACSSATSRTARSTCWRWARPPLEAVAAAKCLAHWTATGAPLALAAPLAAVALGAPPRLAPLIFVTAR